MDRRCWIGRNPSFDQKQDHSSCRTWQTWGPFPSPWRFSDEMMNLLIFVCLFVSLSPLWKYEYGLDSMNTTIAACSPSVLLTKAQAQSGRWCTRARRGGGRQGPDGERLDYGKGERRGQWRGRARHNYREDSSGISKRYVSGKCCGCRSGRGHTCEKWREYII